MSVISGVLSRFEVAQGWRSRDRGWGSWSATARAVLIGADFLATAAVVSVLAAGSVPVLGAVGMGALSGLALVLAVSLRRGYSARGLRSARVDVLALLGGTVLVALAAAALGYLDLLRIAPRALATGFLATTALCLALRILHRLLVRKMHHDGRFDRRSLLVGSAESLAAVCESMLSDASHGLTVLGRCAPGGAEDESTDGVPVVGGLEELPNLIRDLRIDTLVLGADCLSAQELRRLRWRIQPLGTQLLLAPNVAEVEPYRVAMTSVGGTPIFDLATGPSRTTIAAKRLFDRVVGLMLLICSAAVLIPAMLAVRFTSSGPVTFRQTRVGEDGVPFVMYKLRTMYVDAEERLSALLEQSDGNGTLFKMRNDPRVTPVGRLLRRLSIDELPQLWNVARADMSLVGPRPPLPQEVATYDDLAYHRLYVKPGLTGLWQVSGRSDLSWDETVRLDLRYVDNWSMGMDLRILARTVRAVLGGRGAY